MIAAKLLICDDVDDIRMFMRLAFESTSDFEVVGEAANGEESIVAARKLRPDAILLDVNMPVKGGLEALPDLREAVPDAAIVIFSGFEEWGPGGTAKALGADAYIEKGADVGEILDLVRCLVRERRRAITGA
jgi:DNA-binding NarL/FixJ family response regulator